MLPASSRLASNSSPSRRTALGSRNSKLAQSSDFRKKMSSCGIDEGSDEGRRDRSAFNWRSGEAATRCRARGEGRCGRSFAATPTPFARGEDEGELDRAHDQASVGMASTSKPLIGSCQTNVARACSTRQAWGPKFENARMNNVAGAQALTNAGSKSVQDHIDEVPMWADGTGLKIDPDDGDAVADLGACRRGQVLRRFRCLHDRRGASAFFQRVQPRVGRAWRDRRSEPVRYPGGRGRPRRPLRSVRPQDDVRRRDDHLLRVPGAALHFCRVISRS